jgi:DNA-binding winged helix-turn-helix (wHTH) protein/tetratricopeptide (TPR) repeat protein
LILDDVLRGSLMENLKFFQGSDRRSHPAQKADNPRYTFGPFEFDTEKHLLLREGAPVALPPKCFELLSVLIRGHGRLIEKDHLMRLIWPNTFVEEANLSNLIALLRKALGDSPAQSHYIQTIPKLGYRFAAPVAAPVESISKARGPAVVEAPRAIRIIVFPFRVSTELDNHECLAHDLPASIASTLAELNAFTVRSVQSAMAFDPIHWNPKTVAKEADVDYIVSGSLGPSASGIHAVVHLIQAESGTLQWSKSWEISPAELVQLHQGVVQLLVHTLVRAAGERAASSAEAGMPSHPEAYNIYLLANQLCAHRKPENMAMARDLFVACLEKDPDFAPAWARLGRCYYILSKFGSEKPHDPRLAHTAFERAFAVSPDLVLAHSLYTPVQGDAGEAEKAMVRLLERLASHQSAPELFAALVHACRYCGQLDASLAAHRRALQLDPNACSSVAHTYFALGDYEKTLFWYGTSVGFYLDVLALTCMGREQEAMALLWTRKDKFNRMPGPMQSLHAYLAGDAKKGIAILRAAQSGALGEPELRFYMARQAARFGDLSLANEILLRSVEEGYWSTASFLHDPWLDPLRSTVEFSRTFDLVKAREEKSRAAFLHAGGEAILSLDPVP